MRLNYMSGYLLLSGLLCLNVLAENETKENNPQFLISLDDGSEMICTPLIAEIPIKTSYADLKIPLQKLRSVKLDHEKKIASFIFLNGDKIQGACSLETFKAQTLIGELSFPMKHIEEISSTVKEKKKTPVFEDTPARKNACINNLRQIDAAKEQFALANKLHDTDTPGEEIGAYLRGGWKAMKCPAGGTYTINSMNKNPECTVPGHALRQW
ncbi:MAG: hypothetical protein KAH23_04910 [Kiritimatiellae bacterium]|nr:hypothetical protein [Kiritimatiellia bacterium]